MIDDYQLNLFRQEKETFEKAFQSGIQFHSKGEFQAQLIQARDQFFSEIGKTGELSTELYESISETFLEWFFFHFRRDGDLKTPREIFLESDECSSDYRDVLERAASIEWGLFEVTDIKKKMTRVKNLMVGEDRLALSFQDSDNWARKKGQIVQARFFPFFGQSLGYFSQSWIHPAAEKPLILTICNERRDRQLDHDDFMLASFQIMIRTRFLQDQLGASRSQNWLYESLWRKYA